MFCPSCGAETAGQVRFCRACGKPLSSAGSGNPYETKVGQDAKQPPPPAADPFKTVVAMQAPPKPAQKPNAPPTPPPTPPKAEPDPFATQVSPSFGAADIAKELAKAQAAKQQPPPPTAPDDTMKTVVAMQAPNIPKPTPPPAKPPPSKGPDPMATMVAMPAITAPPKKPTAAEPPKVEPKPPEPKVEAKPIEQPKQAAPATHNAPAQVSVPIYEQQPFTPDEDEEKKGMNMTLVVAGIAVIVVVVIIVIYLVK
jgi:hypothetical protein